MFMKVLIKFETVLVFIKRELIRNYLIIFFLYFDQNLHVLNMCIFYFICKLLFQSGAGA